ncbi:WD repeat domain-containing protein [Xylariaceae sp. FL0016]|nr:WD repeat domain-containing protein [Xylariaceae sp. FL0016]
MANAWLDSLSEDWVSQPRSDASQVQWPAPSSPPALSTSNSTRDQASRMSRLDSRDVLSRKPLRNTRDSSIAALSERSRNETNIRASIRNPSKLSHEWKYSQRRRSISASTGGSVIHNTVQHGKSQGTQHSEDRENAPEWKRRLLYGEVNYGETRDLFSSAGTGLENIFKPLEPYEPTAEDFGCNSGYAGNETTLPSSPPPYRGLRDDDSQEDESVEPSANESIANTGRPRKTMIFRRTEDDTEGPSEPNGSTMNDMSNFRSDAGTNEASSSIGPRSNAWQYLDASRKTSGQSIMRHEGLSPIVLSQYTGEDGTVSFAPVDLPAQQLQKKLEQLRRNQMMLDSDPASEVEREALAPGNGTPQFENTEDYAQNGGFLNLRRGGRSTEDSFRTRPLSSPLFLDTSEMLPESSLQASTPKQFPTLSIGRKASEDTQREATPLGSPVLPRAPHPSPEKRLRPPTDHSTSPLKLFGPYDTYTNQTLLRRISQFEDQMTNSPSRASPDETAAALLPEQPSQSESGKVYSSSNSPAKVSRGHLETFGAVNKFGAGELNDFEFDQDLSLSASDRSRLADKENMSPLDSRLSSGNPFKFEIHEDDTPYQESLNVQRRRLKASDSGSSSGNLRAFQSSDRSRPPTASNSNGSRSTVVQATPKREGSEGKRPRTSPSKDPTPKRRRTLHRSDIAYELYNKSGAIETVQSSHHDMQSALDRKRSGLFHSADPSLLAMHQISRPRSPTPSQRASGTRERQPLADLEFSREDIDDTEFSDSHGVADNMGQASPNDGSRKTSMKTQDFFDAAEEIMAMIRNKARPKSELPSVEESMAESSEQHSWDASGAMEDSYQESTKEPFSRPPSRDGRPLPRMPVRQLDPELVDRLKKYEEGSDLGEIITQSLQSMGITRDTFSQQEYEEVISDLTNVRISRNPDFPDTRDHPADFPTNSSSGSSTGRSIPTASSSGRSDSRRLIAPDVVTQLIGDQVGNMVFDKSNKKWHKVKVPRPTSRITNILPSEDSEEDPFASIPDLSVDTVKETQNLDLPIGEARQDLEEYLRESGQSGITQAISNSEHLYVKSVPQRTNETLTRLKQTQTETAIEDDEEIEHEITIHEDRLQKSSPSRRRNLTITFSSPIASIIQDVAHRSSDEDENTERDSSVLERSTGNMAAESLKRGRQCSSRSAVNGNGSVPRSRSRSRGVHRSLSVKGKVFVPRPVSRIDERDEDSPGDQTSPNQQRQVSILGESSMVGPEGEDLHNRSLSIVLNTPGPTRFDPHGGTPVIGQYVGTLSLSPLSEFTMHQPDQSCGLEVSYVVGEQYLRTGDGSKNIMSKAIRSLVEKITEVEPFEPDWESMRELDISNKNLDTLHMLDEFCTSVVTLDASQNSISHLEGVPHSIRNLRMTHNHLSELTAWGHLMNLQYVDISDNQINSLYAFKDLVHLRTLRADNNQITSLDGIKLHDSLQVLRVRGNLIEDVDFDGTQMQRLTELDLEGNEIKSIENIEQLPSLSVLNLEHNRLTFFGPSRNQTMPQLKYLKLSNNALTTIDLSPIPLLRLFHADRNCISTVAGFRRCQRLDSLSLREQSLEGNSAALDVSFLADACEVRKIFLSGNLLTNFKPSRDLLNLQYLELANCGLSSLPASLGSMTPNLRVVNLNFNALTDLSPLRGIPRLKKLYVAGNRLSETGEVAELMSEFPHLARLDIRDNACTLGFYPPSQTIVPTKNGDFYDPWVLPDADAERLDKFQRRLDMGTRQRKRIYDIVFLEVCRHLKDLDGVKTEAIDVNQHDDVRASLIELGVLSEVAEARVGAVKGNQIPAETEEKRTSNAPVEACVSSV